MNKVSVTYRAVGSAALKPEYTFKQNASTIGQFRPSSQIASENAPFGYL